MKFEIDTENKTIKLKEEVNEKARLNQGRYG